MAEAQALSYFLSRSGMMRNHPTEPGKWVCNQAQCLQQKASYVGFDWDKVEQVWDKVHEEILELKDAQANSTKDHMAEEIGDVLFAIVNLSRFLDIPAEDALRRTNRKFTKRFALVEKELQKQGKTVDEATLEEMDAIWSRVKGIKTDVNIPDTQYI